RHRDAAVLGLERFSSGVEVLQRRRRVSRAGDQERRDHCLRTHGTLIVCPALTFTEMGVLSTRGPRDSTLNMRSWSVEFFLNVSTKSSFRFFGIPLISADAVGSSSHVAITCAGNSCRKIGSGSLPGVTVDSKSL